MTGGNRCTMVTGSTS